MIACASFDTYLDMLRKIIQHDNVTFCIVIFSCFEFFVDLDVIC